MLRLFVLYLSIFFFFLCFVWGRGSSRVMRFCPVSSEIVVRQVCSHWTKSLNVVWPNVTWFLTIERLRFTFTPNGKRQIQVENLSE